MSFSVSKAAPILTQLFYRYMDGPQDKHTLGFWLSYCSVLGGVASWQLYQYLTNHHLASKHTAFSWPMFIAEMVGTLVLAMGLSAAFAKTLDTLSGAVTYGASYFVGILIAATASLLT